MSTFRIPPTKLALENPHPRDEFISFDEGPHIYTVHGDTTFSSVTTFIHSHFSHFDADAVITNMMYKIRTDPTYKYYGLTREQIKAQWTKNGQAASGSGTNMHNDIEKYYNDVSVENDSVEFGYFKRFVQDFPELKPYRTEWTVYYEELKLSGSIDMIFENPDGTLQMYDWKRSKGIEYEAYGDKCAKTKCISHLPDSNFWHYSLQLNIYRQILEEKYGKTITGMYLICIHPDNYNKSYQRIEVQDLRTEVGFLFEERRLQLNEKKTI
jgi:ATP-dependent exoDNAse (exonuclease V) beta subunit